MSILTPRDFDDLQQIMTMIVADKTPVEIRAGGTKTGLGAPVATDHCLDISALSGVIEYEPEELIITAHAATPLADIESLVAENGQMLAFEPPHLDRLYQQDNTGTIGGTLMANLSGPRRLSVGAARDFLLGFQGISGRGASFRSGSKVVKNVTGYDLSKLLCGSFGTLAVLDEITLKTLPAPQTSVSVVIACKTLDEAASAARAAMQTAYEPSSAAILPKGIDELSRNAPIALIRLEGVDISVRDRVTQLTNSLSSYGHADCLDHQTSTAIWAAIRDVAPLLSDDGHIWRISLAPSEGPDLYHAIVNDLPATGYFDWAGGLLWLHCDDDTAHETIRAHLTACSGGHATLMRAPDQLRQNVPVFEPLDPLLASLSSRIQESFDPHRLLNPGRL
ncbi:MAG: FAD-binding protein [Candidatus Puniceispirillaceae bacterium]